jgi:hypothetical protein
MAESLSNYKERVEVLTKLLKQESVEREILSRGLHHKAGGIAVIKMYLQSLKSRSVKKNSTIQLIDNIVQSSLDELRIIMNGIYPLNVERIGLVRNLLNTCDVLSLKCDSKINLISELPRRLEINKQQEIDIYRLCVNVVEYFCGVAAKQIECTLTQKQNLLIVHVTAKRGKEVIVINGDAKEKLSLIKARLFLLKAATMNKTNWKDLIAFKVEVMKK